MRIRFWGTRGSMAKPGPSTLRYGGDTSCVEAVAADGTQSSSTAAPAPMRLARRSLRRGAATRAPVTGKPLPQRGICFLVR